MEIKNISNKESFLSQNEINGSEKAQNSGKTDKVEISREGKKLAKSELSNLRLQVIRGRIGSKYYDSSNVLSKVADKIYNEIK